MAKQGNGNPKTSMTTEKGGGNRFPTGGGSKCADRFEPRSAPGAKTGSNSLASTKSDY